MDFIELPETKKGNKWILTLVDHATGWPVALPMPTATSQRVVDALWEHIVLHYGFPHEILSDRGRNFLAPIVSAFLKKANIKRLTTSAYHPRTNGKVERYNGILESYLQRMNTTGDKTRWDGFLDAALFATRVRHREGARWSPFELLYGCKPRLAGDEPTLHAPSISTPSESELTDRLQNLTKTPRSSS